MNYHPITVNVCTKSGGVQHQMIKLGTKDSFVSHWVMKAHNKLRVAAMLFCQVSSSHCSYLEHFSNAIFYLSEAGGKLKIRNHSI